MEVRWPGRRQGQGEMDAHGWQVVLAGKVWEGLSWSAAGPRAPGGLEEAPGSGPGASSGGKAEAGAVPSEGQRLASWLLSTRGVAEVTCCGCKTQGISKT